MLLELRLESVEHLLGEVFEDCLAAPRRELLGAGRGVSEMAYIMLGSGIGAGLIIGGQVYRGSGGTAGEIGHVLVDEHGPLERSLPDAGPAFEGRLVSVAAKTAVVVAKDDRIDCGGGLGIERAVEAF